MTWLKRFFGGLFALILFGSLLSLASSIATQRTFKNPDQIKTWLVQSKIYEKLVPAALTVAQEDTTKSNGDGSVNLKDPNVQKAAQSAFNPQVLQHSAEQLIDANYAWLNGKTSNPEFKIDLTEPKQAFAEQVGKNTEQRLSKLTVCTAQQQAALQIPIETLTVTCRPASLDPKTEGQRVTNEILKGDFLSNPVITQDTFGRNTNDPKTTPYYKSATQAPLLYKISKYAPYVFGLLILLSALIIIFTAPTKRKGWRRVAGLFLSAGIILVITRFTSEFSLKQLEKLQPNTDLIKQLKDPANFLIEKIAGVYWNTFFIVGITLIATSFIIFLTAWLTNRGQKPSKNQDRKTKKDDELPADASTNPLLSNDDKKVTNPFDNKPSDTPDTSNPSGPPVIGGGGTATGGKKRPPLIQ